MKLFFKNIFSGRHFYKTLAILAVPIIIQNFITSSLNFIDTLMVGALGENEIAAVGIANQFFFFYNIIIIGATTGYSIFISQYWGNGDKESIKKVIGIGIISIFSIGFIFTILALFFPKIILGFFSEDPSVIKLGTDYLRIVCLSYIFTGMTLLFSNALKSTGDAVVPLIVSIIAFLLNALLNYVLIFGKFGFPALGVKGSATATLIARTVEVALITLSCLKSKYLLHGKLKQFFDLDFYFIKKIHKSVIPVILNDAIWGLGLVLYAVAYGKIGTQAVAAVQISTTIQNIFLVVCYGIASASLVMVGHQIGAGRQDTAREYAKKFTVLSFIIGIVLGIIVIFTAPSILNLFNVSAEVTKSAITILVIFSFMASIRAVNSVLIAGIFRGSGDASFALKAEAFSMWAIGVPLAFIGAVLLKLSIQQVTILIMSEEIVKFALCIFHLRSNKWIYDLVNIKS